MIDTKRLKILKWTNELAPDFFELTQDSSFTAFQITNYKQESLNTARLWIKNNPGKYAVIEKESGRVIGMGGLTPWVYENENLVDLTYRLSSTTQGKGYGFELAEALINFGFTELKLQQITATITPDNIPSIKLAEKLGMKLDKRIILLGIQTDLYRLKFS